MSPPPSLKRHSIKKLKQMSACLMHAQLSKKFDSVHLDVTLTHKRLLITPSKPRCIDKGV